MAHEIELDVFSNSTITVEFDTTGYDNTDCGGGVNDVDEWTITHFNDKPAKDAPAFIMSHLNRAYADCIVEACYAHLGDC